MPSEDARERDAVKPFDGFHRAVVPKVFQPGGGADEIMKDLAARQLGL